MVVQQDLLNERFYKPTDALSRPPEGWEKIKAIDEDQQVWVLIQKKVCGRCGGQRHALDATGVCQACKLDVREKTPAKALNGGGQAVGAQSTRTIASGACGGGTPIVVDESIPGAVIKAHAQEVDAKLTRSSEERETFVPLKTGEKVHLDYLVIPPQGHVDIFDRVWLAFDDEDRIAALRSVFSGEQFRGLEEQLKRTLITAALDAIDASKAVGQA